MEQVRVAVLRLRGMVVEASTLAAQLGSARRRRLLCLDRRRRRQLPRPPTVDHHHHRPAADNDDDLGRVPTDAAVNVETTATDESSCLEVYPLSASGVTCRLPPTSTASDLTTVADRRDPSDLPLVNSKQPAAELANRDRCTGDVETTRLDDRRRFYFIISFYIR